MYAVLAKFTGVAAYLAFVAGLGALCVNLSSHLGRHAMALTAPILVATGERPLTLVERRRLDATVVAEAEPAATLAAPVTSVPDAPSIPLGVLVAQMDLSEAADLAAVIPATRRAGRSRSSRAARPARLAAADVFGRSFGVMVMASR